MTSPGYRQSVLETVVETVPNGILVVDDDRQFFTYNQRFVEMWGIPDDVVEQGDDQRALESVLDELERPDEFLETVEYFYDNPEEVGHDVVHLSDGRIFDRYTAPAIDGDGTYYGRIWVFEDITERRKRERTLERERDRYTTLFEHLPNPVVHGVLTDGEAIVRNVNSAFESTFGYDAETITGDSLHEYILPEQANDVNILNEQLLDEGEVHTEVQRETADGVHDFRVDIAMRAPETGPPEGYAIYTDITERKEWEQTLKRKNERLDEFTSIVSHDIRNPLQVAQARVELAREDCNSEHPDAAMNALERITELIEDLLTLAQQGKKVDDVDEVVLADLVAECWKTVETTDATLIADTDQTLRADRSRLKQLLENLIGNAVDHGGEDVTVTVGELDDGFYIADDGPGIPPDEREKIFERGYTTSDEGTGFGLRIVKQVVEAHDWTVTVTESNQAGARFEIDSVEEVATR